MSQPLWLGCPAHGVALTAGCRTRGGSSCERGARCLWEDLKSQLFSFSQATRRVCVDKIVMLDVVRCLFTYAAPSPLPFVLRGSPTCQTKYLLNDCLDTLHQHMHMLRPQQTSHLNDS